MVMLIIFNLWVIFFLAFLSKVVQRFTVGVCKSNVCLVGKTALVTGGNSGMGYETSLNLASRGCKVIIADVADSTKSVEKIVEETGNGNIFYKHLDLASLASVRKFAEEIKREEKCLDILINNAGVGGFEDFTNDGLFRTMQINHLGPFLLTHLLIDLLKQSKNGRIVFASSLLAFTSSLANAKDMNQSYKGFIAYFVTFFNYSNTKVCNSITTQIMATKLKKHGISVNCHHPGIVSTGIYHTAHNNITNKTSFSSILKILLDFIVYLYGKTPTEGAQNNLHCALSKELETNSGNFIADCRTIIHPPKTKNKEFCQEVWDESELLVKLTPEEKIQ